MHSLRLCGGLARRVGRSAHTWLGAEFALATVLAAAGLAGAAHADPFGLSPPLASATPEATPAAGTSRADALDALVLPALPANPEGYFNPLFRAQAAAPTPAPANKGPWGVLSGDWQNANVLGDIGGLRPALGAHGITIAILENVETFGNLTGGSQTGFEVDGLTTVTVQMDTQKAFGLAGGLFNVSGLQYWGGDLSANNLHDLQVVSDIFAPVGVRLWELWYQQKFGDKVDVKVGEQSLDEEFVIAPSSQFFINSASGWPALPAADLSGGGPAYPLAGLGVRGRVQPTDNIIVLAGLFNGSPIPKDAPNTPASNPYGVSFPLNTGVLAIAELQFTYGSATPAKGSDPGPLPGVYKIGAWWDSEPFDDQRYDTFGLPLASPESNGTPATHHGLFSLYGVADQAIWRATDDTARTLNVFVRPMFTPSEDRDLIDFSVQGGLTLKGPFPGRDTDTFGVEAGYAQVSSGASGYDSELNVYNFPDHTPVRSAETFLEASYQAQILPSWQVQPDVQYVINPGAGIVNPEEPTQRIKNEWVIGVRTNIMF